jgi:hypothetical protein
MVFIINKYIYSIMIIITALLLLPLLLANKIIKLFLKRIKD